MKTIEVPVICEFCGGKMTVGVAIVIDSARRVACDCKRDAELFSGGVCGYCGHRDHGKAGCNG